MKSIIRITIIALIFITGAFGLSGCASSAEDAANPQALCILVANAMGREQPNANSEYINNLILKTVKSEGYVGIISIDGNPSVEYENSFKLDARYSGASESKLNADAVSAANSIISTIGEVRADDPEIDILKAIDKASATFEDYPDYTRTIIIIDTGLSTTGELNFQNNLINAEPSTIASLLEERACIPELDNVNVVWFMTEPASPQSISDKQSSEIEAIWKAVIERGHGTWECRSGKSNPRNTSTDPYNYPVVSEVKLPDEAPIHFSSVSIPADSPSFFSEAVILDEELVQFYPDSADYINPDSALSTLTPLADYLLSNPDITLLLAGTIAGDESTQSGIELSYQRASAVRDSLESLGVSADQLIVRGLGCQDPWHIYNVGYDSEAAKQNRKVVLLDASTETARAILDSY